MKRKQAVELLRQSGWLAQIPSDFRTALIDHAELVNFDRDELVFRIGDPPGGIYGIASGGIGVLLPSTDGNARLTTVLRPGVWFGMGPILRGGERSMSFQAIESSTALRVPLSQLRQLTSENTDWTRAVGGLSEFAVSIAASIIADLSIPDAGSRLAATLLRCAGMSTGADGIRHLTVPLTQDQVAEMANISRQSVSRNLARFARKGWLEIGYRSICILEPDQLAEAAGVIN